MRKGILYIVIALWALPMLAANDIVRVSATYEYVSDNPRETPEQAEKTAFERAKQKALGDKFGVDVASVTNTLTVNNARESQTNVFALGGTAVRGEWIETIKEDVLDKQFSKGFWVVRVHVEGRARNYATEKADIQFTLVKDIQDLESPVTFRDGNDFYMRFSSPVAGYLCVYLIDETQHAYCLLPYMSQQTGSQPVSANKEYVFFSSRTDKNAQEYTLTCERSSEQNALYVIFSPNEFIKAADKEGGKNFRDEQLPRELTYESFLKWLTRIQTKDPQLVVRPTVISIRK